VISHCILRDVWRFVQSEWTWEGALAVWLPLVGVRKRLTAAATIPGRCRRRRSVVPKKTERGARYGDELYQARRMSPWHSVSSHWRLCGQRVGGLVCQRASAVALQRDDLSFLRISGGSGTVCQMTSPLYWRLPSSRNVKHLFRRPYNSDYWFFCLVTPCLVALQIFFMYATIIPGCGHSKIARVRSYYLYCMWLPLLTSLQIWP